MQEALEAQESRQYSETEAMLHPAQDRSEELHQLETTWEQVGCGGALVVLVVGAGG